MIPILYPANETQFQTNGVGALKDAMSCYVHEILNGEYELTMEYPVSGQHFSEIQETRLIYVKPNPTDPPQLFEIYKIGRELNGIVTVYAQHISYRLSMIPVTPFTALTPAEVLLNMRSHASYNIPFTISVDTARTGAFETTVPMSSRAVIGQMLQKYNLEVKWNGFDVTLSNRRGADNGVVISYGKNLTDLSHETDLTDTITGVLPYWTGMVQGATATDQQTTTIIGEIVLDNEHDVLYPYHRVVAYDFSNWWGDGTIPTLEELQQAAEEYLSNYQTGLPDESMDASFIPLWLTEEFKDKASVEKVVLGDTIRITASNLKSDITARIVEVNFDVLKERYEDIITGKARGNLSEQFTKMKEQIDDATEEFKTELQKAIDKATDMITGNNGGYIKFMYDADGKPYEMLVMDNEDVAQAQNIWRFNQSGLGHSSYGYNGPYTLAILMDGSINADMITTGALNASLITTGLLDANVIRTGVIKDEDGDLVFDIDHGTLTSQGDWNRFREYYGDKDLHEWRLNRVTSVGGDKYGVERKINGVDNPYVSKKGDSLTATFESHYGYLYDDTKGFFYGTFQIGIHDAFELMYYKNSYTLGYLLSFTPDINGDYNLFVGDGTIPKVRLGANSLLVDATSITANATTSRVSGESIKFHATEALNLLALDSHSLVRAGLYINADGTVIVAKDSTGYTAANGTVSIGGTTYRLVNGMLCE